MMRKGVTAAAVLLLFSGALAQQPVLPPPGSLVSPPAAPGTLPPPQNPAQSAPVTPPPADQNRLPEVGGPTEIMLESRTMLVLKGQSNWDDGFDNLMEAFKKIAAEAAREKLVLKGRPQAAFTSTDDFGFKFEAMLQLEAAPSVPPAGLGKEFTIAASPSGKALKFTHSGAYDDIDTTYEAITAYLDEKGLKARNLFVEEYETDPKSSEDAELVLNILVLIE